MNTGNQQQQQQQIHPATIAQQFLIRTELKGGEVEAYTQIFNWLQGILDGEYVIVTKKDVEDLIKFRAAEGGGEPALDVVKSGV